MPRNASGIFTLAESAFVTGTTILSAAVNSDLSDIATALTQSVATTGVSTLTGPLKLASGSVTAPSLTFSSATGTGFYLSGTNEFSWTAAGVLQATFGASGNVIWVGTQTFQGAVTFSSTVTLGATTLVTASEPALTIRNSDNDASEHELIRYALGSGAGDTASRRIIGTGANDVSQIRDYIASTEILRQTASLVSPKKNLSLDAGIIVLATAGYTDFTEIVTPSSPSANIGRIYSKDLSGTTIFAYLDNAGVERLLIAPARAYNEYTDNVDITTIIPYDDTIPQNTEGTEILSATLTLKKSNSRVRITFTGWGNCGSSIGNDDSRIWSAALFRTGTADALNAAASSFVFNGGSALNVEVLHSVIKLEYEEAPGSVGPHTYTINVGVSAGANPVLRMNGEFNNRLFGGIAKSTLIVEEIYI